MQEHMINQYEEKLAPRARHKQARQIDTAEAFTNVTHGQRTLQIAKEMCRQAGILAKATELRLEVEVRRTYTTLQCELMSGESTKERNALYGLPETAGIAQRFTPHASVNWFELAQKILIRNEVALEMGYPTISNLRSLTDAFNSATKANQALREYERQASSYL